MGDFRFRVRRSAHRRVRSADRHVGRAGGAFVGAIFGTALGGLFWKNVAGTSREVAELERRVSELEGDRGRESDE